MSTKLDKSDVDYSVYLVTDTTLIHSSRTVAETVKEAITGGVSIVQVREKRMSDADFERLAIEVHEVTKRYNVPLIINDRIDVALAIGAEGVHVGQRDTPAAIARARIGPHGILGVSAETVGQARQAIKDGADYIGIQTCFPTATKTTPAIVQGHIGVRAILESLSEVDPEGKVKTVAIGGLNEKNLHQIVAKSSKNAKGRKLDGVAVVTAIVGAEDVRAASQRLREIFYRARDGQLHEKQLLTTAEVLKSLPEFLPKLRQVCPLVYHITNYVSINDCANATLAIGASPIMSFAPEEVEDLMRVAGALVLNIGTLTEEFMSLTLKAGKAANSLGKPVVLDPVGAGATELRRSAVRRLLNAIHVDIIKGNASEVAALAEITGYDLGSEESAVKAKGVDSIGGGFQNPAEIVRNLASRECCVVAMTGKKDIVSDGHRTIVIANGDELQGKITGSGCMLASVIASFAAVSTSTQDHFTTTVAGVVCANLAGEHAVKRDDVRGPGTFRAAFLDELANLKEGDLLKELKAEFDK